MTPEEFFSIWAQAKPDSTTIFYRLYYNNHGEPLFYSMEDLSGNYIDIDQKTYTQAPRNVVVKDGKLIQLSNNFSRKLVPSSHGTSCDSRDVCVVISESSVKWSMKTYEPD